MASGAMNSGIVAICLELEVEVFHDWGGGVCGGRAAECVLVVDGDSTSMFVGLILVRDLVAVGDCSGDVRCGGRIQPGLCDEVGIQGVGSACVPDLECMFAE